MSTERWLENHSE